MAGGSAGGSTGGSVDRPSVLWVFAESADMARRWVDVHAPGRPARVWSAAAHTVGSLHGLRIVEGDQVVFVGRIGPAAEGIVLRSMLRASPPGTIPLVRAI